MNQLRTIDHRAHGLSLRPPGHQRPVLVQRTLPDRRPYLHPLRSPDGAVELTEDMPAHHPWQHGVYIGLNDINGVGFWTEGLHRSHDDGQISTEPLAPPREDGERISWATHAAYRRADGTPLLEEIQHWSWRSGAAGESYTLDLVWDLQARCDIQAGRYPYGGLFVRMPYYGGMPYALLTSNGVEQQAAAEGQPARWVALALPAAGTGRWHGLGVIDHPSNPGHPQSWRVDGDLGFGPGRCIAAAWRLARGESVRQRYRLLAFNDRPAAAVLADQAAAFAASAADTHARAATVALAGQP